MSQQFCDLLGRLIVPKCLCGLVSDHCLLRVVQHQGREESDGARSRRHLTHYVDYLVTQVLRGIQPRETEKEQVEPV
jgi:hypothetical protein